MKCLCCGKEIPERASAQEKEAQWHASCVRKFFGTNTLPELDISESTLIRIAVESTGKGFTVPGVQKKIAAPDRRSVEAAPHTGQLSDRLHPETAD